MWRVLLMAMVACGDAGSSGTCGDLGRACGAGCPSDLECVSDACVPVRGDCGGFAGAACADTSLVCAYPTGSSAGICMQMSEMTCVCEAAPDALSGCPPPP